MAIILAHFAIVTVVEKLANIETKLQWPLEQSNNNSCDYVAIYYSSNDDFAHIDPIHYTQTYTGDTIVQSSSAANAAWRAATHRQSDENLPSSEVPELGAIDIPPPVFFCSVEPSSAAQQKGIDIQIL